jgi:hypothetical protein
MGRLGRYPIAVILLALAVACGRDTQIHIRPDDSLMPNGGADIPPAALAALKECDQGLRAGDDEALAKSMDDVAKQADPETAAIGKGCAGIAYINAGQVSKGLAYIRAAREMDPTPPSFEFDIILSEGEVLALSDQGKDEEAQRVVSRIYAENQEAGASICDALKQRGSDVPCPPGGSPEVTTSPPPGSPSGQPSPGISTSEKPTEKLPDEKPTEKLPDEKPSHPEQSSPAEQRSEPPPPVPEQS